MPKNIDHNLTTEQESMLAGLVDLACLQQFISIRKSDSTPVIVDRQGFGLFSKVSKILATDIYVNGELIFISGKVNENIEVHWFGDNAPDIESVRIKRYGRPRNIECTKDLVIKSFDVFSGKNEIIREKCTVDHVNRYVTTIVIDGMNPMDFLNH